MSAECPMRNIPSTTDIYHRQSLLSSSNSKATHIRNKDGTELITVPSRKVSNPDPRSLSNISNSSSSTSTSSVIPTSTAATATTNDHPAQITNQLSPTVPSASMDFPHNTGSNNIGGKKKKKKKGKQQQQQQQQQERQQELDTLSNNHSHTHSHDSNNHKDHLHDGYYNDALYNHVNERVDQYQKDIKTNRSDYDDHPSETIPELVDPEEEGGYYSQGYDDEDDDSYTPPIQAPAPLTGKKKNKKKKKKGVNTTQEFYQSSEVSPVRQLGGPSKKKDRIWNTSTNEELERIKDFWLSLGEEERRSLVKVEKEAVLRKIKEQQKHSCSCNVCGRKRTAIEEELEVLYDAYYEELEQYAHQQQNSKYAAQIPHSHPPGSYSTTRITPPPPPPGPPPGNHLIHLGHHHHKHQGHRVEEIDDDEFEDDEDEDEEYDEDDDVLDEPLPENDPQPSFSNFGNSLIVQGGVLFVL